MTDTYRATFALDIEASDDAHAIKLAHQLAASGHLAGGDAINVVSVENSAWQEAG